MKPTREDFVALGRKCRAKDAVRQAAEQREKDRIANRFHYRFTP